MEWIPVGEKMPECDKKYGVSKVVLCIDANDKIGFGIYQNGKVQLQHEGWFLGGGVGEGSVKITHWIPLPSPPKVRKRIKED
jgi:hypothetical protein